MTKNIVFAFLGIAVIAGSIAAQTKVSGTVECGKPAKDQSLEVAAGHVFDINQGPCTWTKPIDFGGFATKEDVVTQSFEINGDKMKGTGYSMGTLSNGDKIEIRLSASGTASKDGKMTSEGKWTIAKGTGKAKGLKGGGTFKCSGTPDKTSCDVEGDYTAPAMPAAKK